jgi:hypothetical protein
MRMDEQYWDALTNRIQSAESFLRNSSYSHSPNLMDKELQTLSPSFEPVGTNDRVTESISKREERGATELQSRPTVFEPLHTTLEDGRLGYKNLVLMNNALVVSGPLLIILSAISGIFLQNGTITLIFGVLGVSMILTMSMLKPGVEIQVALANLIQVETVSTDFHTQVRFWAPYAQDAASTEDRQKASQALHDATTFALKALHEYVEPRSYWQMRKKSEKIENP